MHNYVYQYVYVSLINHYDNFRDHLAIKIKATEEEEKKTTENIIQSGENKINELKHFASSAQYISLHIKICVYIMALYLFNYNRSGNFQLKKVFMIDAKK